MLIPLYVLVGVWAGRAGSSDARRRALHDGRVAADARLDRRFGLRTERSPSPPRARATNHLALPRLPLRLPDQGAAVPVPRLAAVAAYPRSAGRGDRRPLGRDREGGDVRDAAHRHYEVPRAASYYSPTSILVLAAARSCTPPCSRSARPTSAASSPTRPWRVGADRARPLRGERPRFRRRRVADDRPRARLCVAVPDRRNDRGADARARSPSSAAWRAGDPRSRRC